MEKESKIHSKQPVVAYLLHCTSVLNCFKKISPISEWIRNSDAYIFFSNFYFVFLCCNSMDDLITQQI